RHTRFSRDWSSDVCSSDLGSGLVVPEYDLILANRAGRGFTAEPGHPNFPEPGRRPATTLHLWAAGPGGGRPRVVGGTPGGANQQIGRAACRERAERPGMAG